MHERGIDMQKIKNFINSIKLEAVAPSTIVRLIMVMIAIAAWILKMFGIIPPAVDENTVFNIVITTFGIIAFLQSYWKNNSWTESAQIADEVMKYKKEELKGVDLNER